MNTILLALALCAEPTTQEMQARFGAHPVKVLLKMQQEMNSYSLELALAQMQREQAARGLMLEAVRCVGEVIR